MATSQVTASKDAFDLEINLLQPNPLQARGLITPESLGELAQSLKQHGILEPIVVAHTPAGYQIIAGERRWRAAKIAGLKKVPVVIRETTPRGMLEMAIVENVQREELNAIERAQAYRRLMEEFGLSNQEIAERVSKSSSFISNSLRLLNLPDALKDALVSGATSEGHMRAISSLEEAKLMVEAYKEVMKRELSVRRTEDLVRRTKARLGMRNRPSNDQSQKIVSSELDKIEADLSNKLKNKVKVTRSRRETRILIILKGNLVDTEETFSFICNSLNK